MLIRPFFTYVGRGMTYLGSPRSRGKSELDGIPALYCLHRTYHNGSQVPLGVVCRGNSRVGGRLVMLTW
jgi:hypothetical protein